MLGSCPKDLLLVHYVLYDLRLLYIVSVKHFYCIDLLSFAVIACIDFSKIALS